MSRINDHFQLGNAVVDEFTRRGHTAYFEYPGYVSVVIDDHLDGDYAAFGQHGWNYGNFEVERDDENGETIVEPGDKGFSLDVAADEADPVVIVDAFEAWLKNERKEGNIYEG